MKRHAVAVILCGGMAVLTSACATKAFVREQVTATETRLVQRADDQDTRLRETSDRTAANAQGITSNTQAIAANAQSIEATGQRVQEVGAVASDAKKGVDSVAEVVRETDTRLSRQIVNRNKYSALETKSVYFASGKSELRDEAITELKEVAAALAADPNAVVELQGFADPRGSESYNYRLTRDRVDAVVRHLVQRYGVELRRIHAVGMGKVTPAASQATKDAYAKSRRVDIRLLAPQA